MYFRVDASTVLTIKIQSNKAFNIIRDLYGRNYLNSYDLPMHNPSQYNLKIFIYLHFVEFIYLHFLKSVFSNDRKLLLCVYKIDILNNIYPINLCKFLLNINSTYMDT